MSITFNKTKRYLVCVDSDGCIMDTMDIKHQKYFGPVAAEVFKIKNQSLFLEYWDKVNLYSETRGINRFKGLVMALETFKDKGEDIADITSLVNWCKEAKKLSNVSLEEEIKSNPAPILEKTLEWSLKVNKGIEELVGKDSPFTGAKETLTEIKKFADVAVVSSANSEALYSEWGRHGLLEHVDIVLGQDAGSKSACIEKLKTYGYDNQDVIMVGDAPGDLEAALLNDVLYYPILFGREDFSWKRFLNESREVFIANTFKGSYQDALIEEFKLHLK